MRTVEFFLIIALLSLAAIGNAFAQEYFFGEGDVLKVTVYEHPDLTTTARITTEGEILLPLVGPVKVGGLTQSEIVGRITKLLDFYIVNPQVTVFVEEFKSRKAVLIGQVVKPGLYVLYGRSTLLELISNAGGLTKEAGDRAVIKREAGTSQKAEDRIIIDLNRLIQDGDMSQNLQLMDGDSVYVPKAGVFYVSGEVKKPDVYKYEENLTVLKAITMAGGFTDIAATNKIRILRNVDKKTKVMEKVGLNENVLPEDVIVVPESLF